MDILILVKEADGSVDAMELSMSRSSASWPGSRPQLVQTLASEDVARLAVAMDPGSVAGVRCLREPVGRAVRLRHASGGRPADRQRPIPIQALIAAVEADMALETEGV